MPDILTSLKRYWPSAMAALALVLPWQLGGGGLAIPLFKLVQAFVQPSQFAFFVLPMLLFPPLLHVVQFFAQPRALWRGLLTWSAAILMVVYSGFYVIIAMVGGREAFGGALPGPGYLLAIAGSLCALVWEPLMERREWRATNPSNPPRDNEKEPQFTVSE